MAKSEFIFNIGDDNVVLTRLVDRKVKNAWLGSPDPATAQEELGEALAEDPKGRITVIIDTLDQSFKEEEMPRVNILDRRKVLARHINMAFPGQNLRGAHLAKETDHKTLIYQLASVPLDGRMPGWVEFIESLPNAKGGYFALAAENSDMVMQLAPKDAPVEEGKNHWRHLIGVNVTGGLRQIIEKNGALCLTRLTQAPPPETAPADFADMILRDFKATITYIRRLGYQVGEPLDLVVLTTAENKAVMEDLTWDGARSVSLFTPHQAGAVLNLGSIGREDQAYCDVLHAAWFASKRHHRLPLTRSLAMGDTKDDIRDLVFAASPYLAGAAAAAVLGWAGWQGYQFNDLRGENAQLEQQMTIARTQLAEEQAKVGVLPYEPTKVRNVLDVAAALESGTIDIVPLLQGVYQALQSDAVVMTLKFTVGSDAAPGPASAAAAERPEYVLTAKMQLAKVVTTADEAVNVARRLESRLNSSFSKGFKVQMSTSPIAKGGAAEFKGGALSTGETSDMALHADEPFFTEFRIAKVGK
jgi:hypothetical protein